MDGEGSVPLCLWPPEPELPAPPSPECLPCPPARLPAQVWDFNRSAEMRDTEGGASKRSVLEQVQKLRTYLAETSS